MECQVDEFEVTSMAMANKTGPAVVGVFKMRVEGMDCGACATKVETALKRLPGVSDIKMNFAAAMLSLQLDEDRTPREVVESKIRALGYSPRTLSGASSGMNAGAVEQEAG